MQQKPYVVNFARNRAECVCSETPCRYNVRLGSRNWLYDAAGGHVDVTVHAIYRHPDYGLSNCSRILN